MANDLPARDWLYFMAVTVDLDSIWKLVFIYIKVLKHGLARPCADRNFDVFSFFASNRAVRYKWNIPLTPNSIVLLFVTRGCYDTWKTLIHENLKFAWKALDIIFLELQGNNFRVIKKNGKISAQPNTIVKQICFPNGNVLFSLSKN